MKNYKFKINGKNYEVNIGEAEGKMLHVNVNGADYQVELENAPVAAPVQTAPAAQAAAPAPAAAPKPAHHLRGRKGGTGRQAGPESGRD